MRLNLQIIIVIALAFLIGGGSAWYSLRSSHAIGGIKVGSWTAWPFAGGSEADPYTAAKVAKDGTIPLGATEGLAFEADRDNSGQLLTLKCDYLLSGLTPPARLWTLAAYTEKGEIVRPTAGAKSALHSEDILRNADGSFRISLSNTPTSGNWMGIQGSENFTLIMRIYDTPATSSTGLVSRRMPSILKGECRL